MRDALLSIRRDGRNTSMLSGVHRPKRKRIEMKYARQCDVTGEGMNAGFCIGDGAMYIKSEKHMIEHITNDTEYASMEEAYDDEYYYYTEWEDEDDYQFETQNT